MKKELEKVYDPKQAENRMYEFWQNKGYFHAEVDESRKPYTIGMPPPNISSVGGGCRAITPSGCPAPTTPPSRRRPR